jgi:hypothetical protein
LAAQAMSRRDSAGVIPRASFLGLARSGKSGINIR